MNQGSPVRKAQAGQLRQGSPGMIDQAEKLMHNSKSRTARSWVSQDIQQEQASQGTKECVVAKKRARA